MSLMRIAVVGLPELAITRYLPTLVTFDDVEILAVADDDPSRVAWAFRRYPVARGHASVGELLAAGRPDAAIVLTPPKGQADTAVPLLRAGVPTLCDRSLGDRPVVAQAIAAAAAEVGTLLAVACPRRFAPVYQAAQQFFSSPSSLVCSGVCYANPGNPQEALPALSEMASLLVWFGGEPVDLQVKPARKGGVAHVHFASGLLTTLAALPGPCPRFSLDLLAEGRSMRVEDPYWAWIREGERARFLDHGPDFVLHPYTQDLQCFLAAARGEGEPGVGVADALRAWKLLAPVAGALLPQWEGSA